MECLCCNQSFTDLFFLKDHYIISHNVDENNYFFKNFLINFLCQENNFVATIFVRIEEMKTIIIFSKIIRWEVGNLFFKKKMGFIPCKAKQPLCGIELQQKEAQKHYSIQEICLKSTYS